MVMSNSGSKGGVMARYLPCRLHAGLEVASWPRQYQESHLPALQAEQASVSAAEAAVSVHLPSLGR